MRPSPQSLRDLKEYPVLYVDDEPENLRIFELTFRREFGIHTATSGEEGLRILNTQPVAIVLSDHRMPGMTGTEFLARAAEVDPKTVRIMVTAYGDAETLQDAINQGSIYRYIPKPWRPDDVRATLLRAIEAYALDRERGQLLQELTVLHRVSSALNRELELERLLELLIRTLRDELGYDGAGVWMRHPKTGALAWTRPRRSEDEMDRRLSALQFTHDNASAFLGRLESGSSLTLRLEDVLDYPAEVRRWLTELAAEEVLVAPLYGKNGLIGALTVDNRRGGRPFTAEDSALLEGLSNQASIAVENARLVEDLRRSREQVRRVDRLGTLGTLAAGLAHEINNPLVSIHTFLSMASAKRSEDDPEFWGEYHALACREVERIRGLVTTMQRLGRGGVGSQPRVTVDVGEVASEVVTLLAREAELGLVQLRLDRDPVAPKIAAVRDQIHQVLLNLVLNALAVTPPSGAIRVRTSGAADGSGLEIEISDTGPGIPPEHLEQIFDPFFTTKGPDEGTGLGLMVCHRIVTDHGGSIDVTSRAGQGATFRVRLPVDGGGSGHA